MSDRVTTASEYFVTPPEMRTPFFYDLGRQADPSWVAEFDEVIRGVLPEDLTVRYDLVPGALYAYGSKLEEKRQRGQIGLLGKTEAVVDLLCSFEEFDDQVARTPITLDVANFKLVQRHNKPDEIVVRANVLDQPMPADPNKLIIDAQKLFIAGKLGSGALGRSGFVNGVATHSVEIGKIVGANDTFDRENFAQVLYSSVPQSLELGPLGSIDSATEVRSKK